MKATSKSGRGDSRRAKLAAKILREARRHPGVKEAMIAAQNSRSLQIMLHPQIVTPDIVTFSDRTN